MIDGLLFFAADAIEELDGGPVKTLAACPTEVVASLVTLRYQSASTPLATSFAISARCGPRR